MHLVFHERNERGDYDAGAFLSQCRYLKRDTLATARRHETEGVASGGNALDDVGLDATKTVIAPILFENS